VVVTGYWRKSVFPDSRPIDWLRKRRRLYGRSTRFGTETRPTRRSWPRSVLLFTVSMPATTRESTQPYQQQPRQ
jgi:hypothetical protein